MTASLWDYEHAVSRRSQRVAGGAWTLKCAFKGIPKASVDALTPADMSYFPGDTASLSARCLVHSIIDYDSDVNGASVILYYRPLNYMEWMEGQAIAGTPRAILRGRSGMRGRRVKFYDGQQLVGRDMTDTTGTTRYEIKSGTNARITYHAVYQVYGIIGENVHGGAGNATDKDIYFYQFVSKVGCYNANVMGNMPLYPLTSAPGQWMLSGISCSPLSMGRMRLSTMRLSAVHYQFMLNTEANGWADPCVTQKMRLQTQIVNTYDANGAVKGTRVVPCYVATGNSVSKVLVGSDGGAFSVIDNIIEKTW